MFSYRGELIQCQRFALSEFASVLTPSTCVQHMKHTCPIASSGYQNGLSDIKNWQLHDSALMPADTLICATFYAMEELARKHKHKDRDYRISPGPCSTVCRLRHPAKHMRCLASVLRKFLLMRPILPKFLLGTVKEWEVKCSPLFGGLPKVATITRIPFLPLNLFSDLMNGLASLLA